MQNESKHLVFRISRRKLAVELQKYLKMYPTAVVVGANPTTISSKLFRNK